MAIPRKADETADNQRTHLAETEPERTGQLAVLNEITFPVPLGFSSDFLLTGHLLCHKDQELPIALIGPAQKPPELLQRSSIPTAIAPDGTLPFLVFEYIQELGRFLTVIKELVKRYAHRLANFSNVSMAGTV